MSKRQLADRANTLPVSRPFPLRVSWDITHACNLRCQHCYVIHQDNKDRRTEDLESLEIARRIRSINPFVLSIAGGEPTLHPKFIDILELFSSTDIWICIATNGMFLTADVLKKLSNSKRHSLQISLDGATPEVNDNIRGNGTYKKTIEAIERSSRIVSVTLSFTITSKNISHIPDIFKIAAGFNLAGLKLSRFMPSPSVPDPTLKLSADDDFFAKSLIRKSAHILGHTTLFQPYPEVSGTKVISNKCPKMGGRSEITITPSGNVHVCGTMLDHHDGFGNILKKDFTEIWRSALTDATACGCSAC